MNEMWEEGERWMQATFNSKAMHTFSVNSMHIDDEYSIAIQNCTKLRSRQTIECKRKCWIQKRYNGVMHFCIVPFPDFHKMLSNESDTKLIRTFICAPTALSLPSFSSSILRCCRRWDVDFYERRFYWTIQWLNNIHINFFSANASAFSLTLQHGRAAQANVLIIIWYKMPSLHST